MHLPTSWMVLACAIAAVARGTTADSTANLLDAEETYELRLERILNAKGHRAVVDLLVHDLAEKPRPYAKAWYANYLLYGAEFGVNDLADPKRGFALAKESLAEGSLFGTELVGRAWGDGRGTPFRDSLEALKYLREAAEKGRDSAMSELAKYYFFGKAVPRDTAMAEEWARKAACRGATAGLDRIAQWSEDPKYTPKPDPLKALQLYYESGQLGSRFARNVVADRAKQGDREAQKYVYLDLVVGAVEGADPLPSKLKEAVKWLEANATADDQPVQLALADVMKERRLAVYNVAAAREKLAQLVAAGNDDARYLQGMMAWRGIGESTDHAKAVAIWKELAEKGNARALNQVGWLRWWGNAEAQGVPKDGGKAFELCRRAADLGYWAGQLNTADAYADGIGTPVNYYLAAKYYDILEKRGYIRARKMKERILAYVKD